MTRTNLTTGFLGSGKTTPIFHLPAWKPADEEWTVLMNEPGKVGIDGVLLTDSNALLREIPDGCMCCANGLPMQVGLSTLLRQGEFDCLLIEPIGLGHPKQILDILAAVVYEPWIDLCATVCTLDSHQLLGEKAVNNDNFRDQLTTADIIVTSKNDREAPESVHALAGWWQCWGNDRRRVSATQGNINPALLDEPRRNTTPSPVSTGHVRYSHPTSGFAVLSLPERQRWRRHLNSGRGYQTCGWIFDAETVFETIGLSEWVRLVPMAYVKGAMRTTEGAVKINRQDEDWHIETLGAPPPDSRIRLISANGASWNALQTSLLRLRLS